MKTTLSCDRLEDRDTPSQIPLLDPLGNPVPLTQDGIPLVPLAAVVGWAGALAPVEPAK